MREVEMAASLHECAAAIRDVTKGLQVQRNYLFGFLFAAVLPACAISGSDDTECVGEKCDGTGGGTCPDKRYGNGTCDPELSCAVPDIDCFKVFPDDETAATWYAGFEEQLAMEGGNPPRAILPTSHPEFARFRAMLDRGWEAFRANRPVGLLTNKRPALVLVDDPSINAFVVPDLDLEHAGFAVMVHAGLFSMDASEDAMLGLMMHELQHAVGLHVLPALKEKLKTYYVAPAGKEPIGRMEMDDPKIRAAASEWFGVASEIGYLSNPELGGMPLSGQLFQIARTVLQSGLETNPIGCQRARDSINAISTDLATKTDAISGAVTTDASVKTRVDAAFTQLKTECLASFQMSFVQVVAAIANMTPEAFEASLTPEDKALVTGKHIVDAIRLLGEDRRAKLRAIEAAFVRDTGRPWSALRYFSTEEDADDTSVPVLRAAGLSPIGLGDFLSVFLDDSLATCRAIIDGGNVPHYGVDLVDDHHGSCWRIYHIEAYANETAKKARAAEAPRTLTNAPARKRLLPPTLKDVVMH